VGAEAVRTADRRIRRDQPDRAGGDPVVLGDAVGPELSRPERSQKDGARQRRDRHHRNESRKAGDAEDRAGDEERRDRGCVVELDRGLVGDVREQVGGELGQSREQDERRG
jgi:hypothetical protein